MMCRSITYLTPLNPTPKEAKTYYGASGFAVKELVLVWQIKSDKEKQRKQVSAKSERAGKVQKHVTPAQKDQRASALHPNAAGWLRKESGQLTQILLNYYLVYQ